MRLTFAVKHPYAHGIVTLSTETARALLNHLKQEDPAQWGEKNEND